jgi:hypothetical protein
MNHSIVPDNLHGSFLCYRDINSSQCPDLSFLSSHSRLEHIAQYNGYFTVLPTECVCIVVGVCENINPLGTIIIYGLKCVFCREVLFIKDFL